MEYAAPAATAMLQMLLYCIVGGVAARWPRPFGVLHAEALKSMSTAIYWLYTPALMLATFGARLTMESLQSMTSVLLWSIIHIGVNYGVLGKLVPRLLPVEAHFLATFQLAVTFNNSVSIPVLILSGMAASEPLASDPEANSKALAAIFLYSLPWNVLFWSFGLGLLQTDVDKRMAAEAGVAAAVGGAEADSGSAPASDLLIRLPLRGRLLQHLRTQSAAGFSILRRILTPPTIGMFLGVLIGLWPDAKYALFATGGWLEPLGTVITQCGAPAIPLGNLLLAATLYHGLEDFLHRWREGAASRSKNGGGGGSSGGDAHDNSFAGIWARAFAWRPHAPRALERWLLDHVRFLLLQEHEGSDSPGAEEEVAAGQGPVTGVAGAAPSSGAVVADSLPSNGAAAAPAAGSGAGIGSAPGSPPRGAEAPTSARSAAPRDPSHRRRSSNMSGHAASDIERALTLLRIRAGSMASVAGLGHGLDSRGDGTAANAPEDAYFSDALRSTASMGQGSDGASMLALADAHLHEDTRDSDTAMNVVRAISMRQRRKPARQEAPVPPKGAQQPHSLSLSLSAAVSSANSLLNGEGEPDIGGLRHRGAGGGSSTRVRAATDFPSSSSSAAGGLALAAGGPSWMEHSGMGGDEEAGRDSPGSIARHRSSRARLPGGDAVGAPVSGAGAAPSAVAPPLPPSAALLSIARPRLGGSGAATLPRITMTPKLRTIPSGLELSSMADEDEGNGRGGGGNDDGSGGDAGGGGGAQARRSSLVGDPPTQVAIPAPPATPPSSGEVWALTPLSGSERPLPPGGPAPAPTDNPPTPASAEIRSPSGSNDSRQQALEEALPMAPVSIRTAVLLIASRLLLSPAILFSLFVAAEAVGVPVIGTAGIDNIIRLTVLVQAAAPSAQSVLLLCQTTGDVRSAQNLSLIYLLEYPIALFTMTLFLMLAMAIVY